MTNIRWGILSTARIATTKMIPALQRSRFGQVVAIASRDAAQAADAARRLGIERSHGSYEALLADPGIDAVYIPLPNPLHVPWTRRVIAAGKHVLCEKPIAMSSAEAEELRTFAAGHPEIRVMEAFMYRFHPQWQQARRWIEDGEIGPLRSIQSCFTYYNTDPANIRNRPGTGGGGLMDIGCYCVSLARWLFDEEPTRVLAQVETDPDFGVDQLANGILEFSGGSSTFTCATQLAPSQRVLILGTTGRIEIEIPFNPPPDGTCRAWLTTDRGTREERYESTDHYTLQGDAFAAAILDNTPVPVPLDDAVANMRVLERLFASARDRAWR